MISSELREEFTNLLHAHVPSLHITSSQATGHVSWREDKHPSFSADIEKGVWYDLARKEGGGVKEFKARLGLNGTGSQKTRKVVATYDYQDESGTLLFQVVRFEPKDFLQRRPDGNGRWIWSLHGTRRVLYHLPRLLMADTMYVVEGEKDADRLWSLGLPATTNPQGAGEWREEYTQYFAAKRVVLLPDNDRPGEQHALHVARSLLLVGAAVKIVRLPELPPKGDVSDWLDAGHTKEELAEIVQATPILTAEDLQAEQKPHSNGLVLTKLGDLLNEPEESVAWLVDKLLPAGGFSLLVAKPKAGKSTLARNLALAVAQGRDFFGKLTQQGPVLYLALEEKRSEVKKHFRDMGATGEEDIYIFAASAPAGALQQIRAVAEEKKLSLIIVDPLFRLTRVKDSNDYAQVTAALEPLLVLARETGAHVLCVHHVGKRDREGGDSILGSTAIFAAVDTALMMKRSERYRTISSQQRYGEDLPETVLRFDTQTRTISLGESKEEEEEKRLAEAIVEFLKTQKEPVTEEEIKGDVEGRNPVKERALRWLLKEEEVYRQRKNLDKTGNRNNPFLYTLAQYWFTDSQHIYGSPGVCNEKEDLTPQEDLPFTGSQDFPEAQEHVSPTWKAQHAKDLGPEDAEVIE